MHKLIQNLRPQVEAVCRNHHILRLELFGSGARGEFDALNSDIDLLVEFEPFKSGEYADHYFGALEEFEALFGRRVDLVVECAVKNPYFLESVNQSRELLYAA